MRSERQHREGAEVPLLDRQAFVRHLARMRQWGDAMREQLVAEGITPAPLPPAEDDIPESGSALQITMLRAELRQAGDLVQDAEQEIEQHEREILVLKDQLNDAMNEAMTLRKRLAIEPPPEAIAAELAEQQARLPMRRRPRGKGSVPGVIRALGELGEATVQELEAYLDTSTASVKSSIYAYRERLAKTRREDGRLVYRLADAPAAGAVGPGETIVVASVPYVVGKPIAPPEAASMALGPFDALGERIVAFLTARASAAAPPFIAKALGVDALDVEAAIVALEVSGRLERRDLGTIAQWRVRPAAKATGAAA